MVSVLIFILFFIRSNEIKSNWDLELKSKIESLILLKNCGIVAMSNYV